MTPPIILSIAGSDPSGGAGIQADIKAISALGAYAAAAVTAVTVQNTQGVSHVYPLPADVVQAQVEAVLSDLHPHAVKIGMVHDAAIVRAIAAAVHHYPVPAVVYDPVMISTSGRRLMTEETVQTIIDTLFPLCTLITPNLSEAALLCGRELVGVPDMEQAACELTQRYATACLVKGGHLQGDIMCDVLYTSVGECHRFTEQRIETNNLHGTGCTLSSAIATKLAFGCDLPEAVRQAKDYVSRAIRAGKDLQVGNGNGPLWHFVPVG